MKMSKAEANRKAGLRKYRAELQMLMSQGMSRKDAQKTLRDRKNGGPSHPIPLVSQPGENSTTAVGVAQLVTAKKASLKSQIDSLQTEYDTWDKIDVSKLADA